MAISDSQINNAASTGTAAAGAVGKVAGATGSGDVVIGGTVTAFIKNNLSLKPVTPATAAAAAGLAAGGGLGVPGAWSSVATALNDAASFTKRLNNIVNLGIGAVGLYNFAKNNLPGCAMMVGGGIISNVLKNGGVDENNIVISALNRANQMVKDPISFLKVASRAQSNAQASFDMAGPYALMNFLGSVGNLLVSARTLTDLVTGGVSSGIGPGAQGTASAQRIAASGIPLSANDIRQALSAVAEAIRGFGTLYDLTNPTSIGTPIGLINSLRDQGIADTIGLDAYLTAYGLDPAADLETNYSPVDLKLALSTVTGKELEYVIGATGVTLHTAAISVQSLADLLNPYAVLPASALEHIPGASLENFGQVIASWGITENATWAELADILSNLIIPDCPDINNVNLAQFYGAASPYIPSGSGVFGQAKIQDFIGTAGGHVHAEAHSALLSASQIIQNSAEGKAVTAAMDYFELHQSPSDPLYNYAVSQMQLALQNLHASSNPQVQAAINASNSSCLDSALQMVNEVENAVAIGIGVVNAVEAFYDAGQVLYAKIAAFVATSDATKQVDNTTEVAKTIQSVNTQPADLLSGLKAAFEGLNTIIDAVTQGIDSLGLGDLLRGMITNDAAGQALQAAIAEAQNKSLLSTLGISASRGTLDYHNYSQVLAATKGYGLTTEQIRIISTDAILTGKSVQDMLALNSLYGYNSSYYDKLGYR